MFKGLCLAAGSRVLVSDVPAGCVLKLREKGAQLPAVDRIVLV